MRNKVLKEILDETSEETKAFVDAYTYTKIIMNNETKIIMNNETNASTDKLLKELDEYFKWTPREQVLKDWEECKELDKNNMVTIDELLNSLGCSINYNFNKETMLHISKTQAELIFKEVESNGPHEEFSEVHIVDELYATIKYRDNELYLCLESDQAKEIDVEGLGCEYTLGDL